MSVFGTRHRDYLFGKRQKRNKFSGSHLGNDVLVGGNLEDELSDIAGDNRFYGGQGNDHYFISRTGHNIVADSAGDDRLYLISGKPENDIWYQRAGDDFVLTFFDNTGITGSVTLQNYFLPGNRIEKLGFFDNSRQAQAAKNNPGYRFIALPEKEVQAQRNGSIISAINGRAQAQDNRNHLFLAQAGGVIHRLEGGAGNDRYYLAINVLPYYLHNEGGAGNSVLDAAGQDSLFLRLAPGLSLENSWWYQDDGNLVIFFHHEGYIANKLTLQGYFREGKIEQFYVNGILADDTRQRSLPQPSWEVMMRAINYSGPDKKDGTDADDLITGDSGSNEIHGLAGNDWIYGGAWDDKLYGNHGNDWLFGGAGNDRLEGGIERDYLAGGTGDDWLFGDFDDRGRRTGPGRLGDSDHYFTGFDEGHDHIYDSDGEHDRVHFTQGITLANMHLTRSGTDSDGDGLGDDLKITLSDEHNSITGSVTLVQQFKVTRHACSDSNSKTGRTDVAIRHNRIETIQVAGQDYSAAEFEQWIDKNNLQALASAMASMEERSNGADNPRYVPHPLTHLATVALSVDKSLSLT